MSLNLRTSLNNLYKTVAQLTKNYEVLKEETEDLSFDVNVRLQNLDLNSIKDRVRKLEKEVYTLKAESKTKTKNAHLNEKRRAEEKAMTTRPKIWSTKPKLDNIFQITQKNLPDPQNSSSEMSKVWDLTTN